MWTKGQGMVNYNDELRYEHWVHIFVCYPNEQSAGLCIRFLLHSQTPTNILSSNTWSSGLKLTNIEYLKTKSIYRSRTKDGIRCIQLIHFVLHNRSVWTSNRDANLYFFLNRGQCGKYCFNKSLTHFCSSGRPGYARSRWTQTSEIQLVS